MGKGGVHEYSLHIVLVQRHSRAKHARGSSRQEEGQLVLLQ